MRHYVQYHNTDRLENRPPNPRSEGFRVWSSKSQKELGGCIGQTVWLIRGESKTEVSGISWNMPLSWSPLKAERSKDLLL